MTNKTVYCNYYEEDEDFYDDCIGCERYDDCDDCEEFKNARITVESVSNTEIFNKIKKDISLNFNLNEEQTNKIIQDLSSNLLYLSKSKMEQTLKSIITVKATEYIEHKASKILDNLLKESLDENITIMISETSINKTNIQNIILSKFKQFVSDKNSYHRDIIDKKIEELMREKINKEVDECLKELKEESINKFNKIAMKTMMTSMAKAISQDKRLLKLIELD